jgi:hypothetical protein
MLLHGRVNPNQEGDMEGMDQFAENYPIAAWKTYTQWGPDGQGFFLARMFHKTPGADESSALAVAHGLDI